MSWIKLDDGFFRHPKVVEAGRDGRLLFIAGLCYCGQMLTDGFIPTGALRGLAADVEIGKPLAAVDQLLSVGLWERAEAGYLVHDYLDYNTPSDKVRAERAAAKERMQRKRSENVRPNNPRTSPEVRECSENVRQPETDIETETEKKGPSVDGPRARQPSVRTVKTPVPDDLAAQVPAAAWTAMQAEQQLTDEQLRFETAAMIDHYRGKGERRAEWIATWRNWMRSPYRQSKPPNGQGQAPNGSGYRPKYNAQGQRVWTMADLREEEKHEQQRNSEALVEAPSRVVSR